MYEFESDDKRYLKLIRRVSDGKIIEENQQSQDYCDFVSWLTAQKDRVGLNDYNFDAPGYYFADEARMLAHCKKRGIMLYAPAPKRRLNYEESRISRKQLSFRRLSTVAALREDEGDPEEDGIAGFPSDVWLTIQLYDDLQPKLADDTSDIRRLSSWPIDRAFVYVDVSDFSQLAAGQEALVINSIISIADNPAYWNKYIAIDAMKDVEAKLCIGDGYIFVLKDAFKATFFAAWLGQLIELLVARRQTPVAFHFRAGVHYGPVYCFWDSGRGKQGDWNYIGDGINGGQRVLGTIERADDTIYISGQVREQIQAKPPDIPHGAKVLTCLQNRGRREDKHKKMWRVYELEHTNLCGADVMVVLDNSKEGDRAQE